jgi:hypothetical protein
MRQQIEPLHGRQYTDLARRSARGAKAARNS